MVRVVPGVPDSDILEQTSVRPQNVVSPGPHHLSLSLHVPRPSVHLILILLVIDFSFCVASVIVSFLLNQS